MKEVASGMEWHRHRKLNDIKVGDNIEAFTIIEVKQTYKRSYNSKRIINIEEGVETDAAPTVIQHDFVGIPTGHLQQLSAAEVFQADTCDQLPFVEPRGAAVGPVQEISV